jgi:hypothetical protein
MQTVRDESGKRYVLVKRSAESSRVRDPETGEERYLPNEALTTESSPPLVAAASGVPASVRRVLTATHDDRSLGLLVELVDRGPCSVVGLLDAYDLCESDLHGLLGEFRAAGLVTEATVYGERGYEATDLTREAVGRLRDDGDALDGDRRDAAAADDEQQRTDAVDRNGDG